MNYSKVFQEAFHLIRTKRAVLSLGLLSALSWFLLSSLSALELASQSLQNNFGFICGSGLVSVAVFVVSYIAEAGLIYCVHLARAHKEVSFSIGWSRGKASLRRILGFSILISPLYLAYVFLSFLVSKEYPTSAFSWLVTQISAVYLNSLLTLGYCAIVIDEITVFAAAKTSLRIVLNNFVPFSILGGIFVIARFLVEGFLLVILVFSPLGSGLPGPLNLDIATYQKALLEAPIVNLISRIFNLFIYFLTTIVITIAYEKFTQDFPYPALKGKRQAN